MSAMILDLGSDLPILRVKLYFGAQSFGLEVTDNAGAPVSLVGSVATIVVKGGPTWAATVTGTDNNVYQWDLSADDTDVTWTKRAAALVVTESGVPRTWAVGNVEVIQ